MNINTFLEKYKTNMYKKFDDYFEESKESLINGDSGKTTIKNMKKRIIEELRGLNDSLAKRHETYLTEDELKSLEKKLVFPFLLEHKLTSGTEAQIEKLKKENQEKKEKLHNLLEEVAMLASYQTEPEEITKILKAYNLITETGNINYRIIEL